MGVSRRGPEVLPATLISAHDLVVTAVKEISRPKLCRPSQSCRISEVANSKYLAVWVRQKVPDAHISVEDPS